MKLRIGSVPYLNAKPLVDWFHSSECIAQAEITYAVPSQLAQMLRDNELDVANVSIFEAFQNPDLALIPGISISAYGAVKSVRLFSQVPLAEVRTVALDTSSLTSVALTRVLLAEQFGAMPRYISQPPHLETMLSTCDAGLIIGDLKLFSLHSGTTVYDLGQGWFDLTGLPFVYAGWLARAEHATPEVTALLTQAKSWGLEHLDELADTWAARMSLPIDRSRDYLLNVMNYELTPEQMHGLHTFQRKCREHDLIYANHPIQLSNSALARYG